MISKRFNTYQELFREIDFSIVISLLAAFAAGWAKAPVELSVLYLIAGYVMVYTLVKVEGKDIVEGNQAQENSING